MNCYLMRDLVGGGGNMQANPHITVRRSAAIGDVVASLCVVDKLLERGHAVEFQSVPNIHCVLRRHEGISRLTPPTGFCHVNLDNAYENHRDRGTLSFPEIFMASANSQLSRYNIHLGDPLNCTPKLRVSEDIKALTANTFKKHPKPWVFICPRSQNYFARTIPDNIWKEAADKIEGTCFWIGMHPAPPNCVDLHAKHFDNVISWLSVADMLVTVDTGPMHVAAAMGIPVVAIGQASSPELHLTDQRDFTVLWPEGLACLNCQKDSCPINYYTPPCQKIDPERISLEVNRRMRARFTDTISAVIAIYKPDPAVLNKCLELMLPQVDEIIVAAEGSSLVPATAMLHPKITYVRKNQRAIGYSRNINHGVRHSIGKWLVLCNDDVYLKPDAVAKMLEVAQRDKQIGLVSNLLRYPDGSIYHSGKVRSPGVMGWGHANHRQQYPAFFEPIELENCCGCCVLMPRHVFYEIGAFDEEYFLFSQDDDMALSVRQAGYKIMFTPHSEGIHLEHQSVAKVGDVGKLVNSDNKIFHKNWHRYLEHNSNRIPGNFEYA